MLIPIRCFTCGNLIADKFQEYNEMQESSQSQEEILGSLGVERYCCRRMLLTTVETIQQVIPFYEAIQKRRVDVQSEMK